MNEVEHALRQVSDDLMADLLRLQELEETKRSLSPDDPLLIDLAEEVERIADRVLGASREQRSIAETASALVQTGDPDAPSRSIDDTPRPLQEILVDWRDAERALADAAPGSPEAAMAGADAARFRVEYQRTYALVRDDRH